MNIKIDHTLLRVLPQDAQDIASPDFSSELSGTLRKLFKEVRGVISIMSVGKEEIKVTWKNDDPGVEPVKGLARMLTDGRYQEAALMLELFKSARPDDVDFLYNLGMAYSDMSELDLALSNLRHLLEVDSHHVNGRVALGVALMRAGQDEDALVELRQAIEDEPENPWAQRNSGACLMRLGQYQDALPHLKKAAELNPTDERAWLGLGQAYEYNPDLNAADAAYRKVLDLNEYGDIAEQARSALSKLAERTFRSATPQVERMDAVMYCLGALEKFANMPPAEVQQVGYEVAMLGMGGINVNNPDKQYTLKSLPGSFTGLHLLCLQYVAFKQFAPEQDIGFDLAKEYHMALSLFDQKKTRD